MIMNMKHVFIKHIIPFPAKRWVIMEGTSIIVHPRISPNYNYNHNKEYLTC